MAGERPAVWAEREGMPVLRAVHCSACGATLFPPQDYGCTVCGAHGAQVSTVDVPAAGRLHSFAVVHLHQGQATPFTIAEMTLDAGPMLRVRLVDGATAHTGQRLRGVVVERDGKRGLEFAPVTEDGR